MASISQAAANEGLESAYRTALSPATESMSDVMEGIGDVRDKFKELWPDVKKGLELLRTLSGFVPGVGAVVTSVIGIVISASDAAFKAVS